METAAPIAELNIQLTVVEIVELYMINLRLSPVTSNRSLSVRIKTPVTSQSEETQWFLIHISTSSIKKLQHGFLENLNRFGENLKYVMCELEKHFVGPLVEYSVPGLTDGTVTRCHLTYNTKSKSIELATSTEQKAASFNVAIQLKVFQTACHIKTETEDLCVYLHKLKLFNATLDLSLSTNICGIKSKQTFQWSGFNTSCGGKKISTDIEHFCGTADSCKKIVPKSGVSCIIKNPELGGKKNLSEKSLCVSSVALAIPPTDNALDNPHDTLVKCILYGPGNLPIYCADKAWSESILNSVFNFADYGLEIGTHVKENPKGDVVPGDWYWTLQPANQTERSQVCADSSSEHQVLYILLSIDVHQSRSEEVLDYLALLDLVRKNLSTLFCKFGTVLQKATSTALNKILENKSVKNQKEDIVSSAVPVIVKSITDIIRRTTNACFREDAMKLSEATTVSEMKDNLTDKLWHISKDTLGVELPCNTSSLAHKRVASVPGTPPSRAKKSLLERNEENSLFMEENIKQKSTHFYKENCSSSGNLENPDCNRNDNTVNIEETQDNQNFMELDEDITWLNDMLTN